MYNYPVMKIKPSFHCAGCNASLKYEDTLCRECKYPDKKRKPRKNSISGAILDTW